MRRNEERVPTLAPNTDTRCTRKKSCALIHQLTLNAKVKPVVKCKGWMQISGIKTRSHDPNLYGSWSMFGFALKWVIFNYQRPRGWTAWLVHSVNSPPCKDSWLIKCHGSRTTTVTCIIQVYCRPGLNRGAALTWCTALDVLHGLWNAIHVGLAIDNTCEAVKKISSLWVRVKKERAEWSREQNGAQIPWE